MRSLRRLAAGFSLTFLLVGGLLGFWVADVRSRQVAFADTASRRLDAEPTAQGWVFTLGSTRFRLTFSEPLEKTLKTASLLLPPDLCAVWQGLMTAEFSPDHTADG